MAKQRQTSLKQIRAGNAIQGPGMAASQTTRVLVREERTEIMLMLPAKDGSLPSPPTGPDTERGPMEGVGDRLDA